MCSLFCQSDTPIKKCLVYIAHTEVRWCGRGRMDSLKFPVYFCAIPRFNFFSSSQRKGNPIHRLGSSLEQYLDTQFAFVEFDSDKKKIVLAFSDRVPETWANSGFGNTGRGEMG